jgi:hypothetical protein
MARFFHSGKRIRERWPAKALHRIFGAVITGEGERRVGQRLQMCYLMTILEFGEEVTFHIVKKNFQVNVDPETVFESEMNATNQPPPVVDADRASNCNVVANIVGGAGLCEEVEQLRAEGIEVDDDNKPLPEDAAPNSPVPEGMRYEYTTPTLCPH